MTLQDYHIGRKAGCGKFSTVHCAKRCRDNKICALKKISLELLNSETIRECERETSLLKALEHQNIIGYLDSFIDDQTNCLCIILEWAEAGDLKRQIRKAREKSARFEEPLIWKIFSQICMAVAHMQERRIMHRQVLQCFPFILS